MQLSVFRSPSLVPVVGQQVCLVVDAQLRVDGLRVARVEQVQLRPRKLLVLAVVHLEEEEIAGIRTKEWTA